MTGYVRPLRVKPGMFPSERFVYIRTVDGSVKEHMVDQTCLESGLILVEVLEALNDRWLVRFPYCCDTLQCWIPADDLLLLKTEEGNR